MFRDKYWQIMFILTLVIVLAATRVNVKRLTWAEQLQRISKKRLFLRIVILLSFGIIAQSLSFFLSVILSVSGFVCYSTV